MIAGIPQKELLDFVKLHQNVDFIANIRKDTALFELPEKTGKRGVHVSMVNSLVVQI